MVGVHQRLGAALVVAAMVGLMWALAGVVRRSSSPALRAYVRLLAVAVALEGVAGLLLIATGHRPASGLHVVYALLSGLAAAASLAAGRTGDRHEAQWLAGAMLGVTLLGVRAVMTGG